MDKQYFLNAGIPLASPMPAWQNITPSPSEQPSNCFPNPLWKKSTENYAHYESALSSMVSSPAPSNSAVSGDGFAIRELIGKLGTICNAGEISPSLLPPTSCYTTPLNSPPKLHMPIMDHFLEENPKQLNSPLPAVSGDPGFAERAAKFSCFGSRSFNGRNTQYGVNNTDFQYKPINPLMGIGNLGRVSSSPSLKTMGGHENKNSAETHMELCTDKKFSRFSESAANSNEESSVSEQNSKAETGLKSPNDLNSRKRRSVTRGKSKEMAPSQADNATKEPEAEEDQKTKKIKKNEIDEAKTEEETKPPEPLKDYIHVRARRGQATDSHSLAERVRREKISERMKLLQDLVPGCNKVTGKALMLDEIINYVQSLQRQVEFLSMKLSTVNPRLDFNMDSLLSKDWQIHQPNPNGTLLHPNYPLDSSVSALYGHQQNPLLHANFSSGAMGQGPVGPLDASLCCNLGLQLPSVDGFGEGLPQFPTFCEDDLQSIVHMGFGENPNRDTDYSQGFPATNQMSHMKTEL